MGRGELALNIARWAISRISVNSTLVLEEPENHVSARSQSALLNLIARTCLKKSLSVIVTTHSPAVVGSIPKENIRLLVSSGGPSHLISNPHQYQISSLLGGGVAYGNLLLTEDECGKIFALGLCEQLDPDLRHQIAAVSVGGDSVIDTILVSLPRPERWPTTIVGVYDGDSSPAKGKVLNWPQINLPGKAAPEVVLANCLLDSPTAVARLAVLLAGQKAMFTWLLMLRMDWSTTTGTRRSRNASDRDKLTLTRALIKIWASANEIEALTFVQSLRKAIG